MLEKFYYTVDFSDIKSFDEIHEILDESLRFAEPYYGNLDSLFDCLTDMLCDISIIEIRGLERLGEHNGYDQKFLEVFSCAKHVWGDKSSDRFFVTIVHEDVTR